MINSYIINPLTLALIPQQDGGTLVLQGYEEIYVEQKAKDIMSESLCFYGSSFTGALEGAKYWLGNINMPPIMVSERLGLFWFPTRSPYHDACLWIAFHGVNNFKARGNRESWLELEFGHGLKLNISLPRIKIRYVYCARLKSTMQYQYEEMIKMQESYLGDENNYY